MADKIRVENIKHVKSLLVQRWMVEIDDGLWQRAVWDLSEIRRVR